MSAWSRCGQPSCWHTPFFHSMLRGTSGQRSSPSRSGLTAAQTSMNGWPTMSTCWPSGEFAMPWAIRLSFEPGHQVVDQHADPALGAGTEVAQVLGQVVDAAEVLHDDALDPQVVAPDLLDELGVVPALDVDPALPGHPRLRAVDGDRAGRRTRRLRGAFARTGGTRITGLPSSRNPGPSGKVRRLLRRSSSVDGVQVAVDGDDLAAAVRRGPPRPPRPARPAPRRRGRASGRASRWRARLSRIGRGGHPIQR